MTIPEMASLVPAALAIPAQDKLDVAGSTHPPRILILYGSLRPQSFSRKLALEAERLLPAATLPPMPAASADVATAKDARPARMECCGTSSTSS